jgi:hypothetical protein
MKDKRNVESKVEEPELTQSRKYPRGQRYLNRLDANPKFCP